MYYPQTKERALEMRESGASLGEISQKLNVAKSTLSFWFKDIVFTEASISKIKTNGKTKSVQGLLRYAESKRKERIERHALQKQKGAKGLGVLSDRDILMVGLGLYWGEGYKYENGEFGFTNSNPQMIRFYLKWLKLWNVEKHSLIFRLTLNEFFRKEEINIKSFWINFLSIDEKQFSKTTFIKTNFKKFSLENEEK